MWEIALLDRDGAPVAYKGYTPVTFQAEAIQIDPEFIEISTKVDFARNDGGPSVTATRAKLTYLPTGQSVSFTLAPPIEIWSAADCVKRHGHIGVKLADGGVTPRVQRIVVQTRDWQHLTGKPAL